MEDERWSNDIATLRQAAEELVRHRNGKVKLGLARIPHSPFEQIAELLDDPSAEVREKAVRDHQRIPEQLEFLRELVGGGIPPTGA